MRHTTKPNPRLAKVHRNYTVDEIARLYDVHRNTVRAWIKRGLRTVDDRRPLLVLGRDLADFLHRRRTDRKRPCAIGQFYCMRCRTPRFPAGMAVAYLPLTPTQGNLSGHCSTCSARLFRRISLARLPQMQSILQVARPQGEEHIDESQNLSLNCDFIKDGQDHAHAPR